MILKALTVQQPFAWAIVAGHKPLENRTWKPSPGLVGQRIAIHAAKVHPSNEDRRLVAQRSRLEAITEPLHRGAIIGSAVLERVLDPREALAGLTSEQRRWWSQGCVAWMFVDPVTLPEPIPHRGQLGVWNVPEDLVAKVLPQPLERAG